MIHSRGASGRAVDSRWHQFREEARRTAQSPEQFSDIEQERYDLDTARVTGEDFDGALDGEDTRVSDAPGTVNAGRHYDDPIR